MNKKDRYVYFLYSSKQHAEERNIHNTLGREFTPGKVKTIRGYKQYTEISSKSTNNYSDTVIVCKGYLSEMKYTNPN